jgi:hypothetical protein
MYQFTCKYFWKIIIEIYFWYIEIKVSALIIIEETTSKSSSYGGPPQKWTAPFELASSRYVLFVSKCITIVIVVNNRFDHNL